MKNRNKRLIWLAASLVGYEWLKVAKPIAKEFGIEISAIITLSKFAKTVMYDGIPIEKWYEFGTPVYEIININDEQELIAKLKPDIVVVGGWRQFIKSHILNVPKHGFVGFHPTLLPFGRGPSPIINSILEGVKNSGLTMFFYTEKLDAGDIIEQYPFSIEDYDYAFDVYRKEIESGKILIVNLLHYLREGNIPSRPQNHGKAYYFRKRSLAENEINLNENPSLDDVYRKVRALSKPYKGAWIKLDNNFRLIIWKADKIPVKISQKPGKLIDLGVQELGIEFKDGILMLRETEVVGADGEKMSFKEFLKEHSIKE